MIFLLLCIEPINDEYTPKDIGDRFIVSGVDDIGQIHGRFLSGGSMAIIPEVDKFKIVTEKQWFFVRLEAYASDLFSALFLLSEYYVAAEPPVRRGESHHSGQTEPPCY